MPRIPRSVGHGGGQCQQAVIMGGTTGAVGGGGFGLLMGVYAAYSNGFRGAQLFKQAGKTAGSTGLMFGLFLSIGTYMRTCM